MCAMFPRPAFFRPHRKNTIELSARITSIFSFAVFNVTSFASSPLTENSAFGQLFLITKKSTRSGTVRSSEYTTCTTDSVHT